MGKGVSIRLSSQGDIQVKQPRSFKNHMTHSIMASTLQQNFSLYVANCTGTRHLSFTSIDIVLTQETLQGRGWGTAFKPIMETSLEDITLTQLLLSIMILQFLSSIFIQM